MNDQRKEELKKMTDGQLIDGATYSVQIISGMPFDSLGERMVSSIECLSEYSWRKLQRLSIA